jgi:hypothetical protein
MPKVSVFQNGSIHWWPDTGTREINDVVVHYAGLHCFGETGVEHGGDHDEPYAILGASSPDGNSQVFRSRIYDDLDGGEGRFDVIEIYPGRRPVLVRFFGSFSDLKSKLIEALDAFFEWTLGYADRPLGVDRT